MQRGAREGDLWSGWTQDLALATAIAVFLAAIGPYGSYFNGPFWQRLVFQLACSWTGLAVIGTGVRMAIARFGEGAWLWGATAGIAALAMVPVTLLNIWLAHLLWPFLARYMTPAKWYGEGLLIAEPASFGVAWLGLQRRKHAALRTEAQAGVARKAEADAGVAVRPALGLLAARPHEVLCLQMEDHYVRVHTAAGSHLVLATFSRALDALGGAPGLRVHRSWWVADGAVTAAERDGRNLRLVLKTGLTTPVARSSVAEVRAKGWLA